MKQSSHILFGRFFRAAVAAVMGLAIGLGIAGCLNVDINAREYRKYWEPYVPQNDSQNQAGSTTRPASSYSGYGFTYRQE
jgi:hypothetical protein